MRLRSESLEERALLATVVVTNALDEVNGVTRSIQTLQGSPGDDGVSLREAILAANNSPGMDVIRFSTEHFSETQTINLSTSLPTIHDSTTIEGPGSDMLVLDGLSGGFRLIQVDDGSPRESTAVIRGMTLTGGFATDFGIGSVSQTAGFGGAIKNAERLTLENVEVRGNSAEFAGGGIYNVGHLTLENSLVQANSTIAEFDARGGGIFNEQGTLVIRGSEIDGNASLFGGGILNDRGFVTVERSTIRNNSSTAAIGNGGGISDMQGQVLVSQSTVSNNSADNGGGLSTTGGAVVIERSLFTGNLAAIAFGSGGGGVFVNTGRVTVANSTLSGNSSSNGVSGVGGGILNEGGALHLFNSTVTQNFSDQGGGVQSVGGESTVTLHNSILTNNNGGNLAGVVSGGQHNLVGSDVLIVGQGNIVLDNPGLGPLQDNGGPTQTHLILPASPAVNGGDNRLLDEIIANSSLTELRVFALREFDQRGMQRIQNGTIDIGAVESPFGVVVPPVNDSDFNNDGMFNCVDVDLLTSAIASGSNDLIFDLTADASVDASDLDAWLKDAGARTLPSRRSFARGDANLDGRVTSADLNAMALNWQQSADRWCGGDFNADGVVTSADMNLLALNWQSDVRQSESIRRQRNVVARR